MEAPGDSKWRGYSLAERDRRWSAVRANAAKEGMDCVLIPPGNRIDGRYLVQIDNAVVVLPTDASKPPIVVTGRGGGNDWVPETRAPHRDARGSWGPPTAEALIDA